MASRPLVFSRLGVQARAPSALRAALAAAHRLPEPECLPVLLELAESGLPDRGAVQATARGLVESLRSRHRSGAVETLVQEFSLSSQEGVALMCLAEALLRIPDRATRDALIRDKISQGDWRAHLGESSSLFVNAAAWGLMLTGRLVAVHSERRLSSALARLIGKGGEPLIRQGVNTAMRLMGEQFVLGETIEQALANGRRREAQGFRYSFDMLGEAARTDAQARRYLQAYEAAIRAIGAAAGGRGIYEGPGISIKLSALHARYERAQRDRVLAELLPRLKSLVMLAQSFDIGVNIDAEEADRLELSLDLLEALCLDPDLAGWDGVGFVVQAYQKRAPHVVDWLIDLAQRSRRRLMVRLVKGAYWDSEIKLAQVQGLDDYPVFTRKMHTDVSFLACARKLLAAPQAVYPQFATHNAHTLAAIHQMAGRNYYAGQYEFQCLHGMGEALYEAVTKPAARGGLQRPCRIYAPVGTHETLLAYLVRRLLENGANTSFVNQLGDKSIALDDLLADPIDEARRLVPPGAPHPAIVLPGALYETHEDRRNSRGLDLNSETALSDLARQLARNETLDWRAGPLTGDDDEARPLAPARPVRNPADRDDVVGEVIFADDVAVGHAVRVAQDGAPQWAATPVAERARLLRRAAGLMEAQMQPLMGLIVREAGKSLSNAVAEVREAVDFLRYYAARIETGFRNETHRPLGVVACISPWNFPLAIFTGQVSAALAAGNGVLAKPAEQTSLIAARAVALLHEAGIPRSALQLLPGEGETVGAALSRHPGVDGVLFTGSVEVAHLLARALAGRLDRREQPVTLVAETGGQNAMIVDSSALAEQAVVDILESAFDSAGQRCSALRLLCVQEEAADVLIDMLRGAMDELQVGNPAWLRTDVGPVIDAPARAAIEAHIDAMREKGHAIHQVAMLPETAHGCFVAPTLIEIDSVDELTHEVFGPVLHVLRYPRKGLDAVVEAINATGYGLTFGVHTRIDETVERLVHSVRAGNIYVNRNMVGAVVGVQPFGGEGLSGTGPKAGGPLYLPNLLSQAPAGLPSGCPLGAAAALALPGPTGESNHYHGLPRGRILCVAATEAGMRRQAQACAATGNQAVFLEVAGQIAPPEHESVPDAAIDTDVFGGALFEGDVNGLLALNQRLAARPGPLVRLQALSPAALASGRQYALAPLLRERAVSINTAAAGGNASLMTVG
ncbi:MAG: trifunctional transcriptional regulator/proline dehydrogenase/L-glutamate gamma-semialdehyde dehydrogenase [Castellaniella sp.]